jgi:ribonuclease P protein component
MISSTHRFKGQAGLLYVYRKGSTSRSKYMNIKYVQNHRTSSWRAAVVVSKKVEKSAPGRNRIRRRIYEQIRLIAPQLLQNHDVVLTVFSAETKNIPPGELSKTVSTLLKSVQ